MSQLPSSTGTRVLRTDWLMPQNSSKEKREVAMVIVIVIAPPAGADFEFYCDSLSMPAHQYGKTGEM